MHTKIFAHRGSKFNRPENTLSSFKEACRVKADGIELDVHLSKDRQLIVIHDEKVNRTSNGKGFVRDLTVAELQSLDAGSWFSKDFAGEKIPLLSEVLEVLIDCQFTGSLNIEIKTDKFHYPEIEKRLLKLTEGQAFPFQMIYSSFNFESLHILHELNPRLDLAALVKNNPLKIRKADKLPFIDALHLRHFYFFIFSKIFNKPCRLWTVNKESTMQRAFMKNTAAIITDRPEKAKELRDKL